ncbi:DUF6266 family protein [Pedobacter sp. B4-66]|uniref:DUF6266 family protein n=1 Tax=Pedobacter sp. B4-66 TaxID=2817280 RepID=UPI001BDA39C6|nr:DUF6266 family protein [Pedobacter sp. B4-66]
MAKLTSGIFGPISGTIGGVVGAHWKDIAYVRGKPKKSTKPPTAAQISSRGKFNFVQTLLVSFHPFITIGFKNMARSKTELNVAFSQNYKQTVTGVYPDLLVDYSKLTLSKGTLQPLIAPEAQLIAADVMKVTWLTNLLGTFDDQIMLAVYSPELKIADGFIGGFKRRDKECNFKFNPKLIGKSLEVYISVFALNGSRVANSIYLGRIEPL